MTVVVADTSPLNYLILIQAIDVLPRLYGAIVVPRQVLVEMIDPAAPDDVRTWASALPSWIDVREVVVADEEMRNLDPGERAAILLAQLDPDALLLIDEAAGRIEASRRGIRSTAQLPDAPSRFIEPEGLRRPSHGSRDSEESRGIRPAQG